LYQAIGQFILYRKALRKADPDSALFLAIDIVAFKQIFDDPEGESLRAEEGVNLLVFDKHLAEWHRHRFLLVPTPFCQRDTMKTYE
jgi:tRNA A58 N-methylase Trm61